MIAFESRLRKMPWLIRGWKSILGLGALSAVIAAIILSVSFVSRTTAGSQLPMVPAADSVYRGAEACVECHPQEHDAWVGTTHAQATSDPVFRNDWAAHGYAKTCLRCHATGYDPDGGQITLEGISCEECHGPYEPKHPPSVMPVSDAPEFCGECHRTTYNEWLLSAHARNDVTCTSCHAVHSQSHTMPDGQLPCASCHAERYEDFAHATHAEVGADCETCHMYTPPAESMTEGRVSTGHTFTIGPEACASCHRDQIHTRHEIPDLVREISTLRSETPAGMTERLSSLEEEVNHLQRAVIRNTYVGVAAGGIVGMGLGFTAAWLVIWLLDRGRR